MTSLTAPAATRVKMEPMLPGHKLSTDGSALDLIFSDSTFTFHALWLYDARCDYGSSRGATDAFCQEDRDIRIQDVKIKQSGVQTVLEITWNDNTSSRYPALWLRVLAPLVAKNENSSIAHTGVLPKGWLANDLHIPEISYEAIMSPNLSEQKFLNVKTNIIDTVLLEDSPGIIKIIDLPPVDTIQENSQKENLVTKILQRIFGNVFQHSKRGPDETFKVASEYLGHGQRAAELPGYNTNEVLLPHTDHAHYENPVRVQGFHAVQGVSENTFVHAFAALATLRQEDEDLYNALCESPMILGRVASFYNPPFAQATVDTAVRLAIGQSHVKRVRWHPHATGYLLSPFECYERARKAHCKFQEIIRRPSHSVTVLFRPGDLYVWDNFRILHGREKVIERPRLALGQTVIEQVVSDEHRAVRLDWLKDFIDYNWLVQTPSAQLDSLTQMIKAELRGRSI